MNIIYTNVCCEKCARRRRSLLQSLQVKTESSQKNIFFNSEFALTNST